MLYTSFNNGVSEIEFDSVSVSLKQILVELVEYIRKTEKMTHKLL